jgi:lysophospholipase L1-like esterase
VTQTHREEIAPMSEGRRSSIWTGLVVAAVSGVLSLVAVELVLRALRPAQRFFPYHANTARVFYPSNEITPGIEGISHFSTNSHGTRGPELGQERIRLLTIGGSTTACTALDDHETWPFLLMQDVNEGAKDPNLLWVTNSGVDGLNSQHHLMHAKYLLPVLPRIDFVVVYAGLNDVGMWLYNETFDPHYLDDPDHWNGRIGEAFRVSNFTPESWPWYKRLEMWKRASVIKDRILSMRESAEQARGVIVEDDRLEWLKEEQTKRAERKKSFVHRAKRQTLPGALASYGDTLRQIAELVRARGAVPVFVAQFGNAPDKSGYEDPHFWMGAMNGGEQYAKDSEVYELVQEYNAKMKEVAQATSSIFVDASTDLAGEPDLFYDGVHFNEKGAREFARVLAAQLAPAILERDAACRAGKCASGRE